MFKILIRSAIVAIVLFVVFWVSIYIFKILAIILLIAGVLYLYRRFFRN